MTLKMSKPSFIRRGTLGTVVVALLVGLIALWSSRRAVAQPSDSPNSGTAPVAGVAKVTREDLFKEVKYLAEFRPYEEVELHAKVSGYVSQMNVDFGDKVKAGQLLATLEVPELQADLDNAQAAAMKAEADHTNAHLIYTRLLAVNQDHPNLVAEQDLDTAAANDQSAAAAIAAARRDGKISKPRRLHQNHRALRRYRHPPLRGSGRADPGRHRVRDAGQVVAAHFG